MQSRVKWAIGLTLAAGAVAIAVLAHPPELLLTTLDAIHGLGWWGYCLFVAVYVLACVLFVPGSLLTLGAGAAFGVVTGSILVSLSATLGATVSFLVGRYLAGDWVARKVATNPTFGVINHALEKDGWQIVLLTRLSPMFPFNMLNYAFGLTRVPLQHYVLASWIGMMPGTLMYVYVGSLAGVAAGTQTRTTSQYLLYGVGLLATAVVTLLITRMARQALQKRIEPIRYPAMSVGTD